MKTPLILFLSVLPLIAQVTQVQVRVVSIEKTSATTALEAAQPDCDEKLWSTLTADVAAGSAKIVQDQVLVVRSGQRSRSEAIREFPYSLKASGDLAEWVRYPADFTSRNLGGTLEVEATVGDKPPPGLPCRLMDLNLAPEHNGLLAMHPWPVPDYRGAGQMGRVLRPIFLTHKLTTQALTWTGRTSLLAVAASPQSSLSGATDTPFRYTFLRAGLDGEKPAPVDANPTLPLQQRRLHAVTFRLPRGDAAAMLLRPGDDAALYAALCRQIAVGSATLSGHTAILVRQSQRSKVECKADFPFPEASEDVIPEGWAHCWPGQDLEAEADDGRRYVKQPDKKLIGISEPEGLDVAEGPEGRWNLFFQSQDAPEMVPWHPKADQPALHGAVAEYVERSWSQQVRIPSSGVLCSAVLSTSPATDEAEAPGGLTDVCFLLQSPPPGPPGTAPQSQVMLHAFILSVPAEEGPALARADLATGASSLLERLSAGELTCAAHAAAVIRSGNRSKVNFFRRMQPPGKSKPPSDNSVPHDAMGRTAKDCGLSLEAEDMGEGEDITIYARLEWDTAPVLPFGEAGVVIPELSERRCVQKIELRKVHLTRNQPLIADVRPSNARAGTPEHGRWHILVLLAR